MLLRPNTAIHDDNIQQIPDALQKGLHTNNCAGRLPSTQKQAR